MALGALTWQVGKLEQTLGREPVTESPVLEVIRRDPTAVLRLARLEPDPWQAELLNTSTSSAGEQVAVLTGRQMGKSTTAGALAVACALTDAPALILLLSPTLRQSGELFRKVQDIFGAIGRPVAVAAETLLRLELTNGSRIISLPGSEETIRGYSSVRLLIIDEAARVPDELYRAVRPMLAVSQGRLVALSTPFGKRGWFHSEYTQGEGWRKIEARATECQRISPEFLERERRSLGERWYAQEYCLSFEEDTSAFFSADEIARAFPDEVPDRKVILFPD